MLESEQVRTAEAELTTKVEREYEGGRVFVRAIRSGKYSLTEERRRQREAPRVYKSSEAPWKNGPVKWNKGLLSPGMGLMQTLQAAFEELAPGGKSQKHGHQNSALMYVLNGVGYDIHGGERTDWRAGDVLIVPPGVVHQHFNASDTEPARVLVIKTKPLYNFAGLNFQEFVELAPKEALPGWEDFHPGEWEKKRQ
ncbi:MAG TPA: cupin domain-containing protein [Micromonosporaceae bacterium]|nr:cupin domain-containing protein [Micromonosporaceae bacterium]